MAREDERKAKYLKVFSTVEGQWVLADLKEKFACFKQMPTGKDGIHTAMLMANEQGSAEVPMFIDKIMSKGERK